LPLAIPFSKSLADFFYRSALLSPFGYKPTRYSAKDLQRMSHYVQRRLRPPANRGEPHHLEQKYANHSDKRAG